MEVVRVIGEGGFGRVYAVRHDDGEQALKVMTVDATHDPNLRLRFQREAEVIKRLHSEYVPEVYELGVLEDESPFIRMELLQGRSIADVLKDTGPMPWRRVIKLGIQACHALGVAHDAGVLHRDLKPDNLFLVGAGDDERVKVLDFGVATFVPGYTDRHGALTHTSAIVGTPHYMSPEQVRSGELTPSSDLYMLGVMLYQMVTGQRPFSGDNLGLLLSAILSGHYLPIQQLAPSTPRGLVRVVERAMSFESSARFQSAAEMAQALAENSDAESEAPDAFDAGATVPAIPRAPIPRPSNPDAVVTQIGTATPTPAPRVEPSSPSAPAETKTTLAPLALAGVFLMLLGVGLGYAALRAHARSAGEEQPEGTPSTEQPPSAQSEGSTAAPASDTIPEGETPPEPATERPLSPNVRPSEMRASPTPAPTEAESERAARRPASESENTEPGAPRDTVDTTDEGSRDEGENRVADAPSPEASADEGEAAEGPDEEPPTESHITPDGLLDPFAH